MSLQKSPTSHIKSVFCYPISQLIWLQPNAATKSPSASGADVQPNSWLHHCCTEHFCTKIKTLKPQFVYPELRISVNDWCLPCTLARTHSWLPVRLWNHQLLAWGECSNKALLPQGAGCSLCSVPAHCLAWQAEFNQFQGLLKRKTTNPIVNSQRVTHVLLQISPDSPSPLTQSMVNENKRKGL